MNKNLEAEIDDVLMDIMRYSRKVDKTSSQELRKYVAKVQEMIDRLGNIVKVMDYVD